MLPKNHRLNLAKGFRTLKRDTTALQTPFFTILYRLQDPQAEAKIGFVVSNKIGKAVSRNRARRLLREVVQNNLAKLPSGLEMVIVAKQGSPGATYEKIELDFNKVLPKLGV